MAVEGPRGPEEVRDSNDKPDQRARWLVKWQGLPLSQASWEPRNRIPAEMLDAFELQRQTAFNEDLEPLLVSAPAGSSDASGVVALGVDAAEADACASYLVQHWQQGRLQMVDGRSCFGYASYGKTLSPLDAMQQSQNTLLITNALLPSARKSLPGFFAIEQQLADWLHRRFGTVVELFYAHGLRQSPQTLKSTGFAVHQDTEDYDFIEYTVVVKLTADRVDEQPSSMRVVGAKHHFDYGVTAGASGAFRARLFHASCEPRSDREHLKMAFFFRKSIKGERLAKRSLAGVAGVSEELLALQRAEVQRRAYLDGGVG
jgi:hypothetical protein